jgi:hypothetical protein
VRTLLIDIETSPNLAHVWDLWNQNVGLNQLIESTEMLCFSAKWLGKEEIGFSSVYGDGKETMVHAAHMLLDMADVVMHFNGKSFDVPHLNREFLLAGLKPPSPYRQIDLLLAIRKQFRFPSNKLAYVSKALGLAGKVEHEGHVLWVKCLAGDSEAWARMETYNRQDVQLLEELYEHLQPWIPGHPSHGSFTGEDVCPACGSANLAKQGHAYTQMSRFQRYRCGDCGKWSRSNKRDQSTGITEVAA